MPKKTSSSIITRVRNNTSKTIVLASIATAVGVIAYYKFKYGGGRDFLEITPSVKKVLLTSRNSALYTMDGVDYLVRAVVPETPLS